MKYFKTSILFLFFSLVVSAQTSNNLIELFQGPQLNLGNDIRLPEIFGHDESGYYAYSYDYRPSLASFDHEFQSVANEYIDLNEGLRRRQIVGFCHFHDTIYLFTSEERLRSVMLFVETIDKVTLKQKGDLRMILNVENLSGWQSHYDIQLSRQHDKLLVYSRLDVLNKKMQDVRLLLFGEGLNLEWETTQRIIYPRNPPRNSIVKVSDEGDVYFISLLDDQNLRSLWDGVRNRYHLIAVTEQGRVARSYPLSLSGLYIRGVQIEPGVNHQLVCAGFYSPTHFRGNIDGAFYFELDNRSGEFRNKTLHEFEPGVLKKAMGVAPEKEIDELFEFRVRHLIRRNNGDFIMLSENEYDQDYDTYQNIIATSFSPGGQFNWTRVIQKRQNYDRSTIFNYSSFAVHAPKYTDKIYLLFNENKKNEDNPPGRKMKSFYPHEKANLKIIGLGPQGELSSQIVFSKTKRWMITPLPLQGYDKLNHQMVIPALYLKRYRFLQISFNE